jgi:parvulin-like peptidyl-prolyl isomerase
MNTNTLLAAFLASTITLSSWAADNAPPVAAEPLFATVNGKTITQQEFHVAYANYLREKYYHRQVPENQLAVARQDVTDRLVDRILLLDEATKRGLAPDTKRIDASIAEYEARYATSQMWQQNRERMLPELRQQLIDQDLLRQIETIGQSIAEPNDQAIRDYYQAHNEYFTEPEKFRLHTILLKVDPSAPKAIWDAARDEAGRIVKRIRSGENSFEELAKLHSHDASAENGGDMGYLHRGMIPDQVVAQIEGHPIASVTEPIDVLEGIAVFRLDERVAPNLRAYADVSERAKDLLKRDLTIKAWETFIADLRKNAAVKIVEPATLPATTGR